MRALAEWMPSALDDSSAGCDPSPILPGKGDTTLLRACTPASHVPLYCTRLCIGLTLSNTTLEHVPCTAGSVAQQADQCNPHPPTAIR